MHTQPQVYPHRGVEVYGYLLETGDVLQVGDRIANRIGWMKCGEELAGSVMKDVISIEKAIVVIRPLPVAIFPPPPLGRIDPKKVVLKAVPYRCSHCRADIQAYFQSGVGSVLPGETKIHRDLEAEAGLNRALEHMTKGSTQHRHLVSCEECWKYYNKLKRRHCGG